MMHQRQSLPVLRALSTGLLYAGVALGSAAWCFDFGMRAGGTWLAIVAALSGAVFATILVDAMRDAWRRQRSGR